MQGIKVYWNKNSYWRHYSINKCYAFNSRNNIVLKDEITNRKKYVNAVEFHNGLNKDKYHRDYFAAGLDSLWKMPDLFALIMRVMHERK